MIKTVLNGFARQASSYLSERLKAPHECLLVYKPFEDAWTERASKYPSYSWVRPSRVAVANDGTSLKNRRLRLLGHQHGRGFESVPFLMTRVEAEWAVALPAGVETFYEMAGPLLDAFASTRLSFTVRVRIGEDTVGVDIAVGTDEYALSFPDFEADVEADRPIITLPLVLSNVPIFTGSAFVPELHSASLSYRLHPEDKGRSVIVEKTADGGKE